MLGGERRPGVGEEHEADEARHRGLEPALHDLGVPHLVPLLPEAEVEAVEELDVVRVDDAAAHEGADDEDREDVRERDADGHLHGFLLI